MAEIIVQADPPEKELREATAERVLRQFGNTLPEAKLLCFFDDDDWHGFKNGDSTRGLYWPVESALWKAAPGYIQRRIATGNDASWSPIVEHLIYVHGSTCKNEIGLTMTFAHELHHFVQRMNTWSLWTAGWLIPNLHYTIIDKLGWTWADVPHEREARMVSKKHAVTIFGAAAVDAFVAEKIQHPVNMKDKQDWEFVRSIDPAETYDLGAQTSAAFKHLKPYRSELEKLRKEQEGRPVFCSIDLDALLE